MKNFKMKVMSLVLGLTAMGLTTSAQAMQIFVKTLTGKTVTLEVENVQELKLNYSVTTATGGSTPYSINLTEPRVSGGVATVPVDISAPYTGPANHEISITGDDINYSSNYSYSATGGTTTTSTGR